jgi:hypothetical protein
VKKIIYFCPKVNIPSGGIKVIHRHSEIINTLGGVSEIFYVRPEADKIDWFEHQASIKQGDDFDVENDFAILPETQIFDSWKTLKDAGIEFGIFVQNGYLLTENIPNDEIAACYAAAKFIICISEDAVRCIFQFFPEHTGKLIRVIYSVDSCLFAPGKKENVITYMPRKMRAHSEFLVTMLEKRLPAHWRCVAIDNMSETEVARTLAASRIFMAFSDFEGLPIPPVEAALAGNFVIGYTGQGGREYWNPPVFEAIESGDIVRFIDVVLKRVNDMDTFGLCVGVNHLTMLTEYFSKEMEAKTLKKMIERIDG